MATVDLKQENEALRARVAELEAVNELLSCTVHRLCEDRRRLADIGGCLGRVVLEKIEREEKDDRATA